MMHSILFCVLMCLLITGTQVNAVISNEAYHQIYFFEISSDRIQPVQQSIAISGFFSTDVQISGDALGINELAKLDSTTNPVQSRLLTIDKDLAPPTERSISSNTITVKSAGEAIYVQFSKAETGTGYAGISFPITLLSTEYYVMSYTTENGFRTMFSVGAVEDGTCLEIYQVNGDMYKRLHLISLGKGEEFTYSEKATSSDTTGYYVNSTKIIALYSGHECANIPKEKGHCDAAVEGIPPVGEYGSEHILAPIGGRGSVAGYEFRVVAKDQGTVVTTLQGQSATSRTINRGQAFFSESSVGDARTATVYLQCSKPCLVAQYNKGQEAGGTGTSINDGKQPDPFMMLVPPITAYTEQYRFYTFQHMQNAQMYDTANYVTVVAPTASKEGMRLDGVPFSGFWTPVSGKPSYSYLIHEIQGPAGFHSLTHTSPAVLFAAFVYGHGIKDYTSWGYSSWKPKGSPLPASYFDINYQTITAAPATTASWTLPSWNPVTIDRDKDIPKYTVVFWSEFHVVSRDHQHTIGQQVCSNGFEQFYRERRLPPMNSHLTSQAASICGSVAAGVQVVLSTKFEWFYTEYTRGNLSFVMDVVGSSEMTFRQVVACANKLTEYIKLSSNWPQVSNEGLIDRANFLLQDSVLQKDAHCDPLEMGDFNDPATRFVHAATNTWMCNGLEIDTLIGQLISGTTRVTASVVTSLIFTIIIIRQYICDL